ncbi:MAG: ABC transporter permease [Oceanobacter sp.]
MNKLTASLRRTRAIASKEFRVLSRDRMTFGLIVMIPLMQLLLFGYAINTDVRHLPAGLLDMSQTSHSRAMVQTIEASQIVDFRLVFHSIEEAELAITNGQTKAVLYLPPDFERRLADYRIHAAEPANRLQRPAPLPVGQWLVDGSDTLVAATLKNLMNLPISEVSGQAYHRPAPSFALVQFFNPEQRSVVNIVPGIVAIILTMTMILFTAMAIVREREDGNMEFLITTPIHPVELMVGKIIPYLMAGLVQVSIILLMGHFLFGVPIRGSLFNLSIASLVFIAASLTLGLIISTLAKTQLQAMQMMVLILMPSILLSGFMFPYEAMPEPAQWIAEALPATHFMRLVRGIVLRDASLTGQMADLIWLALFTLVGLMLAALRFRKRLD